MRKVLVVEDDKFISAIFAMFLRELGHELVDKSADGQEAVNLCHRLRPDVVLMDIHLEGEMDGMQTAEQLRRELDIPVIYVSSDTSSQIIKRAIVSNSYGYLVKPVKQKELGIAIDLAYYKHKVDQEQRERERGYRQFVSEASMPLMILQNGRIQYLNNLALDLFKTHYIEDVMMLPFMSFVDKADQEKMEELQNQFDNKGMGFEKVDLAIKDVHGQAFYARISGSSVVFNKKKSLQLTIIDNSTAVLCKKQNEVLWKMINELELPYLVTNANLKVKSHARYNLFTKLSIKGKDLHELNSAFDVTKDQGQIHLSCQTENKRIYFKTHKIFNALGKVHEFIFYTAE